MMNVIPYFYHSVKMKEEGQKIKTVGHPPHTPQGGTSPP